MKLCTNRVFDDIYMMLIIIYLSISFLSRNNKRVCSYSAHYNSILRRRFELCLLIRFSISCSPLRNISPARQLMAQHVQVALMVSFSLGEQFPCVLLCSHSASAITIAIPRTLHPLRCSTLWPKISEHSLLMLSPLKVPSKTTQDVIDGAPHPACPRLLPYPIHKHHRAS